MLGHQVWRQFHADHEVWVTLRRPVGSYAALGLFEPRRSISGIDLTSIDRLSSVLQTVKPDAVINCVGIIKQHADARNPVASLTINALLPHRLAELCSALRARLIHISTDCVFSGRRGKYGEEDVSDAEDLYGRTKFLGEVHQPDCVTLRTSIVGRELEGSSGLIEWFLSQEGRTINGYRRVIYAGLTTHALARVIEDILVHHRELCGLWHVSGERITKYDLLCLAQSSFGWRGTIVPDDTLVCDRSLDSSRFRSQTGFTPPSWEVMLTELARAPR
jgi:dTDP-4-dehydrorhamnose reductase